MIKRYKLNLIAIGAAIFVIIAFLTMAFGSGLAGVGNTKAPDGNVTAGTPATIIYDDGSVADGYTPDAGALPITNETQLYAFFDASGEYAGAISAYLANDIAITVPQSLQTRVLSAGRTLDGNGKKITMNFQSANWNLIDANSAFEFINNGVFKDHNGNTSAATNRVVTAGGLLAQNHGTIKNLNIETVADDARIAAAEGLTYPCSVSPIIGLNTGNVENVNAVLNGARFEFHKNSGEWNSTSSYKNTAILGGLTGISFGKIENSRIENNLSVFTCNAKSNVASGNSTNTHTIIGGAVGKLLSDKADSAGTGNTVAVIKDVIMAGSAMIEATTRVDNTIAFVGTNNTLREIGAVVGSNSIRTPSNNLVNDANGYAAGSIDGILMGFSGSLYTSWYIGNNSSGRDRVAGTPVLSCGDASNIVYVMQYSGKATQCDHKNSADWHNKVSYSSIYSLDNLPEGALFEVGIDKAANAIDSKKFNIKVNVNIPENNDDLIFDMVKTTFEMNASDNDASTLQSTEHVAGWDYYNADGSTPFYDLSSPINYKRANVTLQETRPSRSWDSLYNKIEVVFGKNSVVDFGETIADKQFSGTDVPIILKDNNGVVVSENVDSSYISSLYKHPDIAEAMSVRSFYMPGEYSDIKILSSESDKYGCVDTLNKYVAPIKTFGAPSDKITIAFPKITISNIPDPATAYLEYTVNYSLSAGQNILKNVYYSTPNNIWSPADSVTSHRFFKTTNAGGTAYRLAGYGMFDPSWKSINDNAATDKTVQIKVTETTDEFNLIIDHEKPVCVYTDALGNSVAKPSTADWIDAAQTVYFKATDEHGAVGAVTVTAGGETIAVNDTGGGIYNFVVSDDREYLITVSDTLGNTFTDTLRLLIDVVEPNIELTGYANGGTITSGSNVTADLSVSKQTSGATVTVSIDGGAEQTIDASSGAYVFDLNGTHDYLFKLTAGIKGADGSFKSSQFAITVTLNKTSINLTDDDIIVADGAPIVMKYNGTNQFNADEYAAAKARIAWNTAGANYDTLKNLDFKIYYKNAVAGTAQSSGNYLIIEPIDPSGTLDFVGEIRYLKANITPAMVSITIHDLQRAYGEVNPIFTYTLGGLIGGDTAESFAAIPLKTTALADSPAGVDYAIEIDMTVEELNNTIFAGTGYRVNSATVTNGKLTVTKRNLDSDFKYISVPTGADYTGKEIGIEAQYNFDGQWLPLPVAYYSADGVLLSGKPVDVGSYYGILQPPNANFEFVNVQRVDFVINNAEIVITFTEETANAINYEYSGVPKPATYTLSNEDYVNAVLTYYDANGNTLTEVPSAVGSYRVRVEYTPIDGSNFKKTIREIDYIISKAQFVKADGSGVLFADKTVAFNGAQHRLTVENLPVGTTVEFVFNGDTEGVEINNALAYFGAVNQRTYNVTAKLRNPNYIDADIKAVLTITLATMNVVFDNTQAVYDGLTHWIEVTGAPAGAVITFTVPDSIKDSVTIEGNRVGAINAGVYSVTVNITAAGYTGLLKTAVLNITEATMTGIEFAGLSVQYDNNPHRISVTGAPQDAAVVIKVNGTEYNQNYFEATNVGIYSATAKISKPNYKTVRLQASLTINAASLDKFIDAQNVYFDYVEGMDFYYEIGLLSDVNITVNCKELGIAGSTDLRYKLPSAGVYNFEITASKQNYVTKTFSRKATLNEAEFDLTFETVNNAKYNGTDYVINLLGTAPVGTEFTWSNPYENVVLLPNNAGFKSSQAGNYEISVVISKDNYRTITLTGRLFIASANMKDLIIGAKDTNYKWCAEGHSLTIEGIPANAVVNMTSTNAEAIINGNTVTFSKIGVYPIELSIEAPNYNTFFKKFDLTVTAATFDTVICESVTAVFDNTAKSVSLTGVPVGAAVSFTHNGIEIPADASGNYVFSQTNAGSYLVEYVVSMTNYDTKRGTATLTINKAAFNITAFDYEADYNGLEHVFDVFNEFNIPTGTTVEFISADGLTPINGVLMTTDAGVHKIHIKLTLDNYIPAELQFFINIRALNFSGIAADDLTAEFNEQPHTLTVGGIPDGAVITLNSDSAGKEGVVIDGNSFSALHAGVYTVDITLRKANYNDFTKTVTVTINKAKIAEFAYGSLEEQWSETSGAFTVQVLDADGNPVDTDLYDVRWNKLGNIFENAGSYDISATVYRKGVFEKDYEPFRLGNAKFVVKPAKVPGGAYISSYSGAYDGLPHAVEMLNVPEGFSYNFITTTTLTNAGFVEVTGVITKDNYEPLNVMGYINIEQVEVDVTYFVNPSYAEGYQPRVVGRYTDVNGEEINFLVDTKELEYGKAGNYTLKVESVGDANYKVSEATSKVDIIIGVIKQDVNIPAIAGGSAGGGVVLLGGIAATIIIIKKKVVKL